jgi:hypothetical protein
MARRLDLLEKSRLLPLAEGLGIMDSSACREQLALVHPAGDRDQEEPVEIAGIAPVVNGLWMSQVARNLTDAVDGVLAGKTYMIHDRDALFMTEFLQTLESTGVKRSNCRRGRRI